MKFRVGLVAFVALTAAMYGLQSEPAKGTSAAIQVEVSKEVLDEVNTWDKKICFFTSKKSPLRSLDGLKGKEIAAWGAELFPQVKRLYKLLGIPEDEGVRVIGTGNPIFSGMENPPRLFITSAENESALQGAVRIELVQRVQKSKVEEAADSRGGQMVCRKGDQTLTMEVPAGHLAEVRKLAEKLGFSARECTVK